MSNNKIWDIIITGGGVAGLSFAILSAKSGLSVLVIEKGQYPKHKVCGEYISMESFDFLLQLGVPLETMDLPRINNFVLTSHNGSKATCKLDKGGFGLSRYKLDNLLAEIAVENGVKLLTGHKVTEIAYQEDEYLVATHLQKKEKAKLVVGAYGRISGLDNIPNIQQEKYIGVKYHIDKGPVDDTIEIHTFRGGYCGISKIEDNKYCLCYLAKASDIKPFKGDIIAYEHAVLMKNPYLKKRLEYKQFSKNTITANLYFDINNSTEKEYLQIGDAAGFIPPLTGNGMSLAFRSAKDLHKEVLEFFCMNKTREMLLNNNRKHISRYLLHRIRKGIFLQNLLFIENKNFNKLLMKSLSGIPGLMKFMTKQATGETI
ncbi:MAG: NAD(P)/FAD-dependent oxidoreductase [Bacteroidetes bacterium]|nr:NAD(P)/FAD-dependent oxidoreductase [Bacteroidota bacterium]HET6244117.1 NAD(P)/FAD-dependent oxidoreductase [Bacteroidia bacterium]